jgi:hypothetical protein
MADWVRVATFEADSNGLDAIVNEINSSEGPPPASLRSRSWWPPTPTAPRSGSSSASARRRTSAREAKPDGMEPPPEAGMRRISVEKYEIVLERQAP